MDLHEYQAKEILREYAIPSPPFVVVSEIAEIERAWELFEGKSLVLKVQIHAGGRGKAGGVKIASTREEARALASQLLSHRLVTAQTAPEGLVVNKLLISPTLSIKKEYYLAAAIDRKRARPVLLVSKSGGVDIESVPKEELAIFPFLEDGRIRSFELVRLCRFLGWSGELKAKGEAILRGLAAAFARSDARLIEINPLVESSEGALLALDAKMSIDDNALYRQRALAALFDPTQQSTSEVKAFEAGLSYISLDGQIGCLVNGAGLAMATMDLLLSFGQRPANFLDIGGSATKESIGFGFKLILEDARCRSILINIFGGIVNCRLLAEAIIDAIREVGVQIPIVVRLEGTEAELGRKALERFNETSANKLIIESDFRAAAMRACRCVEGNGNTGR